MLSYNYLFDTRRLFGGKTVRFNMVTINFHPIEARNKGQDETLGGSEPPRQMGAPFPRSLPALLSLMAKISFAIAAGFVERDRFQPKIELGA